MKLRHLLVIFLPTLFLVGIFFLIRVIQYEPLYPERETTLEEQSKEDSIIPLFPEDPILGDKKAGKTIVVFGDFGCEECKNEYGMLKELIVNYPTKVKVVWKTLPVTKFPFDTQKATQYGFCAHKENKFEAWTDLAFSNSEYLNEETLIAIAKEIKLDESDLTKCLESKQVQDYITKTEDLAQALNIQAVPSIFIDNTQVPAPKTLDEWKKALSL